MSSDKQTKKDELKDGVKSKDVKAPAEPLVEELVSDSHFSSLIANSNLLFRDQMIVSRG